MPGWGCRKGAEVRSTRPGGTRGSQPESRRGKSPEFARGLSLAFEFAGAVFLFWLLGRLLDNWLETEPWFQVIGSLLGWAGGFLHVYYATKSPGRRPGVPGQVDRQGRKNPGESAAPGEDEKAK
jgi:F0F1-type ATP synthase assembly protein I